MSFCQFPFNEIWLCDVQAYLGFKTISKSFFHFESVLIVGLIILVLLTVASAQQYWWWVPSWLSKGLECATLFKQSTVVHCQALSLLTSPLVRMIFVYEVSHNNIYLRSFSSLQKKFILSKHVTAFSF